MGDPKRLPSLLERPGEDKGKPEVSGMLKATTKKSKD